MAKPKDIPNNLDIYLEQLNKQNPGLSQEDSITTRTSIDTLELYRLRNGIITRFAAKKFYEIYLALERPIEELIDGIFLNLNLPNKPQKEFKNEISDLGKILFPRGKWRISKEELEYKTDIKNNRLNDIINDNNVIILASELILIEKAAGYDKGELFKRLFKGVKVKDVKK